MGKGQSEFRPHRTHELLAGRMQEGQGKPPAKQNSFLRLYLNVWTEQATRWLDLDTYDQRTEPVDLDTLEGRPVFLGLDLSQSYDLACVLLLFPTAERWIVKPTIYMPQETAQRRSRDEGIPFNLGGNEDFITITPGATVDYDRFENDIISISNSYEIIETAFDPYNATQLT